MLKENREPEESLGQTEDQFRDLLREELKEGKPAAGSPKWEAKVRINGYSQIRVVTKSLARCESS